ncbi:hypothetical protein [Gramella sp. MAR_2010_147]|uniref:hypothetical protein n=1 Tax=Gramella sp. MAR_2010_147 TaxID=1250205 RepID=UPI00087BD138|nr:hypothetical protein [Gramella sp. MAR_2010_147]SDR91457.1 hypothetical protein SAMN04488553_1018 [Gramella sp. MAR_2010_147]
MYKIKNFTVLILALFTTTLLVSCQNLKSQTKELNDWQHLNLSGKVKTIKEVNYRLKKESGKITRIESEPLWDHNRLIQFDKNGNKLKEILYSKNQIPDTIWQEYNYQYGRNGKKIKADKFQKWGYPSTDFIITYNYNKKGKLIDQITFDSEGKRTSKLRFTYLSNRIIKIVEYGSSDESLKTTTEFEYDDNFNLLMTKEFDNNGDLNVLSEFNDNGTLQKQNNFKLKRNLTFEYEFDSENNWIKKTILEKEEPVYLIDRQIDYLE